MTSDADQGQSRSIDSRELRTASYAATWQADESLDDLNRRIHDNAPIEGLADRGRTYRDWIVSTFPEAEPQTDAKVLELGSGVGWVMQAMLERFSLGEIVGLDISENMIRRATERFSDERARFVLYDGLVMPFVDGEFDMAYSVASMQHIDKDAAFLLFEELHRIIAPGGHVVLHLLSVDHIPKAVPTFHDECLNHIHGAPTHWHHYYSFDELFTLFSDVIGVTDLDLVYHEDSSAFLVHFSKDGRERFRRPELPELTYAGRVEASRRAASEREELLHTRVELANLADEHAALLVERAALLGSKTYRYTAPLRSLYGAARRKTP